MVDAAEAEDAFVRVDSGFLLDRYCIFWAAGLADYTVGAFVSLALGRV